MLPSELGRRVRFVLCEPAHPGNIGAAARAIKTMGFRDLRVVAPRERNFRTHEEALAYATSSADVLESARMHETLAEALEGVTFAWALTGYDREFGPPMSPLREAAAKSDAWLRQMAGDNSHHIIEGAFKAFGRAMREAVRIDPDAADEIPSSKGVL